MTAITLAALLSLAISPSNAPETVAVETQVRQAVETFQPFWRPAADDAAGLIVGFDPLPPTDADADADPALTTAAYLYHHFRHGGGEAVLTRSERPVAGFDAASRAATLAAARCQMYLTLAYDDDAVRITVDPSAGAASQTAARHMAEQLAKAYDRKIVVESAPAPLPLAGGAPGRAAITGCTVFLPWPAGDPRPLSAGPRFQRDARALYAGMRRILKPDDASQPPRPNGDAATDDPANEAEANDLIRQKPNKHAHRARSIWPEGQLPDDRLDWFCALFAQTSITNRSLVYFDVSAERDGDAIVLRGTTTTPTILDGLEAALAAVGRPVARREVRVLPDERRLDGKLYGVTQTDSALTFDRPSESAGRQTQLLYGEPLFLLDAVNGFYLAHAADGYWGWVRREAVAPMPEGAFLEYLRRPRAALSRDQREGNVLIPRGTVLPLVLAGDDKRNAAANGNDADGYSASAQGSAPCKLLLADGRTLTVPADAVRRAEDHDARTARQIEASLGMLYIPYIFGGRGPTGLDCSGLVCNLSARELDGAARDAWHQVFSGTLSATRWQRDGMQAGDFVYFIDPAGKVYHAGIAISPTHVLHSAPPGVQIGSFDRNERLYDLRIDRDFFMAKRR